MGALFRQCLGHSFADCEGRGQAGAFDAEKIDESRDAVCGGALQHKIPGGPGIRAEARADAGVSGLDRKSVV